MGSSSLLKIVLIGLLLSTFKVFASPQNNDVGAIPKVSIPKGYIHRGEEYSTITLYSTVSSPNSQLQSIWWIFNNGETSKIIQTSTVFNPSLTIRGLSLADEGMYMCLATNTIGTGRSIQTSLSVIGSKSRNVTNPRFIEEITLKDIEVRTTETVHVEQIGNNVTLECIVSSDSKIQSVWWTFNYDGIVRRIESTTNKVKYKGVTTSNPSLTIENLSTADIGSYVCKAKNEGTSAKSIPVSLIVTDCQKNRVENIGTKVTIPQESFDGKVKHQITLYCTVYSPNSQPQSVWWTHQDKGKILTITRTTNPKKYTGMTLTNPSLVISDLNDSDRGRYTCLANNTRGTVSTGTTSLNIIYPTHVVTWWYSPERGYFLA